MLTFYENRCATIKQDYVTQFDKLIADALDPAEPRKKIYKVGFDNYKLFDASLQDIDISRAACGKFGCYNKDTVATRLGKGIG